MSTKLDKMETSVDIPSDVSAALDGNVLTVKGPLGTATKDFRKIPVGMEVGGGKVSLKALGRRKKNYAIMNTSRSLVRNLCDGVTDGYTIKMKVVYAHFPITVKVQDNRVLIENFQGERAPRVVRIVGQTKVESKGEDVVVSGHVLTDVSQTAANIQQGTKVKGKDHRVFLDGIYVYEKSKSMGSKSDS